MNVDKVCRVEKKKDQFQITLSSGKILRVSEEILVRYQLLKGREITDQEWENIVTENKRSTIYQCALHYLSYGLRTEKEVRDYLRRKEFESDDIVQTIQRLKEYQLVDDFMYAESYVRTYRREGTKGPRVVAQKLKEKGVSSNAIEHGLQYYSEEDSFQNAYKQAEKLQRKYGRKTVVEKKQKVRQALLTKGFTTDIVNQVMNEFSFERDAELEQQLLEKEIDKWWNKYSRDDLYKRRQKISAKLWNKGFNYDDIQQLLDLKEEDA